MFQTIPESRRAWMLMVFAYHAKYNKRNRKYQFWQQHNQAIELVSASWINQKIIYIHLNPVRNNLVVLEKRSRLTLMIRKRDGRIIVGRNLW